MTCVWYNVDLLCELVFRVKFVIISDIGVPSLQPIPEEEFILIFNSDANFRVGIVIIF